MDLIAAYDDSDTELNERTSEKLIKLDKSHRKLPNNVCGDTRCEATSNPGDPHSTADFFNLTRTDTSDDECEDGTNVTKECEERIYVSDTSVPNTEFWKGVDSLPQLTHSQIKSHNTNREVEARCMYRQTIQTTFSEPSSETKVNYAQTIHSSSESNTRNIFYVHHKISPHLTSNSKCRAPKNVIKILSGHGGAVNRVSWCPSHEYSHLILTASMDGSVRLWNAFSQTPGSLVTFRGHSKAVKDAVWCRHKKQILSCGYDRQVVLSDVITGARVTSYKCPSFVFCVRCHPVDPNVFVSGGKDAIYIWDCRASTEPVNTCTYMGGFGQVQDLCFINDGTEFASCTDLICRDSCDRNIMVWDYKKAACISNQIYQERYTCTQLKLQPHGKHFVAQSQGNYVAQFSTQRPYKMNKNKRYEGHKVEGYSVGCDFSPDGRLLSSASSDGALFTYDCYSLRRVDRIETGLDIGLGVAWHPVMPSTVAVSSWSGQIAVCQ